MNKFSICFYSKFVYLSCQTKRASLIVCSLVFGYREQTNKHSPSAEPQLVEYVGRPDRAASMYTDFYLFTLTFRYNVCFFQPRLMREITGTWFVHDDTNPFESEVFRW